MTVHDIKIWPQYFDDVANGIKLFELRINDRDYRVGDEIVMHEFRASVGEYTGRTITRRIGYVMQPTGRNDDIESRGLHEGWCILGFSPEREGNRFGSPPIDDLPGEAGGSC